MVRGSNGACPLSSVGAEEVLERFGVCGVGSVDPVWMGVEGEVEGGCSKNCRKSCELLRFM